MSYLQKCFGALACITMLGVAVVAEAQAIISIAPPAAPREAIPPPQAGYAWQPGYYQWNGTQYVWTPGAYAPVPRSGATWVPGHWEDRRDSGYVFIQGKWR